MTALQDLKTPKKDYDANDFFDINIEYLHEKFPIGRSPDSRILFSGPSCDIIEDLFSSVPKDEFKSHPKGYVACRNIVYKEYILWVIENNRKIHIKYNGSAVTINKDISDTLSRWAYGETLIYSTTGIPTNAQAHLIDKYVSLVIPPQKGGVRQTDCHCLLVFKDAQAARSYADYLSIDRLSFRQHSIFSPEIKGILIDPDEALGDIGFELKGKKYFPEKIQANIEKYFDGGAYPVDKTLNLQTYYVSKSLRARQQLFIPDMIDYLSTCSGQKTTVTPINIGSIAA